MFADVIVNISSSNVDQKFEYIVPKELEEYISIGSRVTVPFGSSNREIMGYVLDLYDEKRYLGESKVLTSLLDLKPILSSESIKLANFIKDECICPLIRVLNVMVPSSIQTKTYKYLKINDLSKIDASIAPILGTKNIIPFNDKLDIPYSKIKNEIAKGNIEITYESKQLTNYAFIDTYVINHDYVRTNLNLIKNDVVKDYLLSGEDGLVKNDIIDNYGLSDYMINSLVKKGFINVKKIRKIRIKDVNLPVKELKVNDTRIENMESSDKPYLVLSKDRDDELSLMMSLINKTLQEDKNVIILLPNILSSFRYASMMRKTFSGSVACLNSKISKAELFDYYTNIIDNKYRIIITTPICSLFPFKNVGLYLMLEEENDNYFNDQSPRYDLHIIYHYLSYNYHIPFVMMSLSPSVKSYCYGLNGKYQLIDNMAINSPNVKVIDLKDELIKGNSTYLSGYTKNRINDVINSKGKVLIIVNNKNTHNYVLCRTCGETIRCPKCEISYHYNDKTNMLICPSCGKRETFKGTCPTCGGNKFHFGGVGMGSIYELLANDYNNIIKVDDSFDIDSLVDELSSAEDDDSSIIITSDTLAKGAVNTKVDLVVIINWDAVIKTPSYEANSKAYSLLSTAYSYLNDKGELVVQTSTIDSSPLMNFIKGDFHSFIKEEIENRKLIRVEPFYQVNRIIVKGKYEEIYKIASDIKFTLKEIGGNKVYVIGPAYSKIDGGAVLTVKHRYKGINKIYQNIYERYQNSSNLIIFDKYAKRL